MFIGGGLIALAAAELIAWAIEIFTEEDEPWN